MLYTPIPKNPQAVTQIQLQRITKVSDACFKNLLNCYKYSVVLFNKYIYYQQGIKVKDDVHADKNLHS